MDITGNWSAFWAWSGSRRSLAGWHGLPGRPLQVRARRPWRRVAFIAKAVFNIPTTSLLIEDAVRRQDVAPLMWLAARAGEVPSESTFSRAFAEFAAERFAIAVARGADPGTHSDRLVGHISRDSTAIEAREKSAKSDKPAPEPKPKLKRVAVPARESSAPRRRRVGSNANGA